MATQGVEEQKRRTAMGCSLERVVRHRAYRADERRKNVEPAGGMRVLPAEKGERSGRLAGKKAVVRERPEREPTDAGAKSEEARRRQQREQEHARPRRTQQKELLA